MSHYNVNMSARHTIPKGHHARRSTWNDRSKDVTHPSLWSRISPVIILPLSCLRGGDQRFWFVHVYEWWRFKKVHSTVLEGLQAWRKNACRSAQTYDWFNAYAVFFFQGNMTAACSSTVNSWWFWYADVAVSFGPYSIYALPSYTVVLCDMCCELPIQVSPRWPTGQIPGYG
jgi:hypothetical protein